MSDCYKTRTILEHAGKSYEIYSLPTLGEQFDISRLPFSLKILLENLLRYEDGVNTTADDIKALANWDPAAEPSKEIAFTPSRVIMQDFTGVPAVVDLAAMRDAMQALGGDPKKINPLSPAELVIDHSVMVDYFGSDDAVEKNAEIEFTRNAERYSFLRWGQKAFNDFVVVPPDTGIVHQVNLENLARVTFGKENNGVLQAYPDTVVGTDSHTTMINGAGVLGWGVGGIEAEAAMLGQPITMLIPQVIGFKLTGELPEGTTATDLVLTIVEILREKGVVGKFVEFFGDGLDSLPLADRATIANMAPEYGATCGIFPIDEETLRFLKLTGRSDEQIGLIKAYNKAQGMFRDESSIEANYTDVISLDISTVESCLAGPKRPQDRVLLSEMKSTFQNSLTPMVRERKGEGDITTSINNEEIELKDGLVAIAAITSCTNTSNPAVMLGAGLLAKKANALGLKTKSWVKTSLGPGSKVVTDYLKNANLLDELEKLGFYVVGYGCTTCIGNSGPLPKAVSSAIADGELIATSVLSGNRNFEGRVHAEVKMNFLASPPLVVAYALAGTVDIDLKKEPLGISTTGQPIYLKDIWPSQHDVNAAIEESIGDTLYSSSYANLLLGDERWQSVKTTDSDRFDWQDDSTYIRNPPYFDNMKKDPPGLSQIKGARVLALLGDSITTDHISPAGAIKEDSPAGSYLKENGVQVSDFNSYGSRRGNHEVMMRGTFANIRLRNLLAPGTEGGWTKHQPSGELMSIYDASMKYQQDNIPLIIIAGKEYGTGSSRDWAAKGTNLLGAKAVIVSSYERIHRSNLIGMGVLPLQFMQGEDADTLGLNGTETYDINNLEVGAKELSVTATNEGKTNTFDVSVRIDTPKEWDYYLNGGILPYVLRQLVG